MDWIHMAFVTMVIMLWIPQGCCSFLLDERLSSSLKRTAWTWQSISLWSNSFIIVPQLHHARVSIQPRDIHAFFQSIYWFQCPLPYTNSPRINPGNRPVSRLTPPPTPSLSTVKGKVTLLCIPGTTSSQPASTDVRRSTNPASFQSEI